MTYPYVVADIGGTNARFGLATGEADVDGRLTIEQQHNFSCAEFDSFEAVFENYLNLANARTAKHVCVAAAGPVLNNQVSMTNLDWDISASQICKQFNLDHVELINDFGAQAYAVLYLNEQEQHTLYAGKPSLAAQASSKVIIGPGTGLGVAGLIKQNNTWQPVSSEGGHVSFAPSSEVELEIYKILSASNNHISNEMLLSGPGLLNIYNALCSISGYKPEYDNPAEITNAALSGKNNECNNTVKTFCHILGGFAGDIALAYGASGGVYLGGGILPRISSLLENSSIVECFLNKGVQRPYVETIPMHLINTENPALSGAAHLLDDVLKIKH